MPETWRKILFGHIRTFIALGVMLAAYPLLPSSVDRLTRAILAWDIGVIAFLALALNLFLTRDASHMPAMAEAQEEGEWTIFWVALFATIASFAAITTEFSGLKEAPTAARAFRVGLVAGTLVLSWLLAHTIFALRYAHEWYESNEPGKLEKGLDFPGEEEPDYLDFLYFSVVVGMTFQVSDVQVTARGMRRLVLVHGMVSFLYNTVIVAVTVNIAASLL